MSEPWSGSILIKKKVELQSLATELGCNPDVAATRPELIDMIKNALETQEVLHRENPRFRALYNARTIQKLPREDPLMGRKPIGRLTRLTFPAQTGSSSPLHPSSSPIRQDEEEDELVEEEEVTPETDTAVTTTAVGLPVTPSRVALPPSPAVFLSNAIQRFRPSTELVVANFNQASQAVGEESDKALSFTQEFMSNSMNIARVSAVCELAILLYTAVPVFYYKLVLPAERVGFKAPYTLQVPYPSGQTLLSKDFSVLLVAWLIPTVVLPYIAGTLISFRNRDSVDEISAGIVRLASAVATSYGIPESVLSSKTRIISAATALSFAVAEILSQVPPKPTKAKKSLPYTPTSRRRLLMAASD